MPQRTRPKGPQARQCRRLAERASHLEPEASERLRGAKEVRGPGVRLPSRCPRPMLKAKQMPRGSKVQGPRPTLKAKQMPRVSKVPAPRPMPKAKQMPPGSKVQCPSPMPQAKQMHKGPKRQVQLIRHLGVHLFRGPTVRAPTRGSRTPMNGSSGIAGLAQIADLF